MKNEGLRRLMAVMGIYWIVGINSEQTAAEAGN